MEMGSSEFPVAAAGSTALSSAGLRTATLTTIRAFAAANSAFAFSRNCNYFLLYHFTPQPPHSGVYHWRRSAPAVRAASRRLNPPVRADARIKQIKKIKNILVNQKIYGKENFRMSKDTKTQHQLQSKEHQAIGKSRKSETQPGT